MDYSFIIENMTWSFSRLSSYDQCPYEWKLNYIDKQDGVSSFFGQFGAFMHKILEKYEKGELSVFELSMYYEEHFFKEVDIPAPGNAYVDIKDSYYHKGLDYLDNIDLILSDYEILGVEKQVSFKVGVHDMIGFIDLLLRDKETGKIIILDHKSGSLKFKKNGEISKSSADDLLHFKRQLYLYSKAVIEEYGHVDFLEWNLFKDRNKYRIQWEEKEYQKAIEWCVKTIQFITTSQDWNARPEDYYCFNLCSQRFNGCPYKPLTKKEKEELEAVKNSEQEGSEWTGAI